MKTNLIQVENIPTNVKKNSILEITSRNVSYYTHSFFKYPCKFIPHIPNWAIEKYTNINDTVLDCFAGSGTTLVESVLMGRNALGVDFDKLSQLLCITKTKHLKKNEIEYIKRNVKNLFNNSIESSIKLPDIHNIDHWFSQSNIRYLSILKYNIDREKNNSVRNFLLVTFASIIKKVSNADEQSPKPYVSSKYKKKEYSVKELFIKSVLNYLKVFELNDYKNLGTAKIISEDARDINNSQYENKVDLAVTSPPYINAFDYVRSLRLENVWLDFYGDEFITEIKKKQIGTESISSTEYKKALSKMGIQKLDKILNIIYKIDKKRAHVVFKYFMDMQENMRSVRKLLKSDAHYIIVVGDSIIRKIEVPTHEILIEIAEDNGYELENMFAYIIKNRYLRIPRSNRGGFIKYDWIIDLKKI
ncbi:MAG: hypothetical protein KAT68_18480 [Bacteroidales bacterium]|nr:hypothetical protein [Bacteroidales bacterium]